MMDTDRSREESTISWCQQQLSGILGFDVDDNLARYLLSFDNESDLKEYLTSLLGEKSNEEFIKKLLSRWKPSASNEDDTRVGSPLVRMKQDELVLFAEKKQKSKGKEKKDRAIPLIPPPPGLSACHGLNFPLLTHPSSTTTTTTAHKQQPKSSSKPTMSQTDKPFSDKRTSSKSKFVPLLSSEGQTRMAVHIPGRHRCSCLGQKHTLVNNCLECGRIVCSQEGPGPCLHCGALVLTRDDEGLMSRSSKKANKLKEKLMKQYQIQDSDVVSLPADTTEQLTHAIEHKEKLLEFDKTSIQRTKVIDDESDYFSVDNRWLSDDQRKMLKQREEQLRDEHRGAHRKKKLTIDIARRVVTEEEDKFELYTEENISDLVQQTGSSSRRENCSYEVAQDSIGNPSLPIPPPKYIQKHHKKDADQRRRAAQNTVENVKESHHQLRIQDEKFLEMTDEGKCLSMHQPWASLLVSGIKLHEGRTWYTAHRGKLWIASAAKHPDQSEISDVELFYQRRSSSDVQFPSEYPTGCLLGCVHLTDCLAQDDYKDKYPDGESESPYVFICQNPQQLFVKFPLSGKHKIWTLPKDIHLAAKRACQPLITV